MDSDNHAYLRILTRACVLPCVRVCSCTTSAPTTAGKIQSRNKVDTITAIIAHHTHHNYNHELHNTNHQVAIFCSNNNNNDDDDDDDDNNIINNNNIGE